MHLFITILNLNQIIMINLCSHLLLSVPVIKLFGVPLVFIMKFFGEIFLLFLASALISYILKLDKAAND
jgi:hypothetical protein